MREESYRNVRPYAFLVTQQKYFFKAGKIPGIDGKDNLVDYLAPQQIGQRRNWKNRVLFIQRQSLACLFRHPKKAQQPYSIRFRLLEQIADSASTIPGSHHHDIMRYTELPAYHPDETRPNSSEIRTARSS